MANVNCFLDKSRRCEEGCMAFNENGKLSRCMILNGLARLTNQSTTPPRPVQPAPKVKP